MEHKFIYVVFIKALTGLGKFSRMLNKYEYTHIAVSLDESLEDFVTFSRKAHNGPFMAGFMHEKREHYAFGNHKSVKVKVYKLPVSSVKYAKIQEYIQGIEEDKDYVFNLYSMLTMSFLHGLPIYKAHNCMSFVSKIIKLSGVVRMNKPFYKYSIQDMDKLLSGFGGREFQLKKKREDKEYMREIGALQNVKTFLSLNGKLIYRLLCKRNELYE
ncbi:MAG: hypothetical protein IKK33_11255 [Lachnospiraceae bacterium]|nr:hypothetical protein [Lachnospiraceae bacterium]